MTMTDAIEPAGDAVERVARAMAESAGFAWEACAQEQWRRDARAGLAALPPATASASARALRELIAKATPGVWQEGRAGQCNLVSFDGEDVVGIGIMNNDANRALVIAMHAEARAALASAAPEQAGEFARGVEAAAKVCDEYADRMERSYKARADAGTPSYTAECKADAGQTLATKIRTLARAPETRGWRCERCDNGMAGAWCFCPHCGTAVSRAAIAARAKEET